MNDIVQRFAARFHNLRVEQRMTQEEIAHRAGLHPRYISALENGRQVPSLTTLAQLAKGLNVSLQELMTFEPERKKNDRVREELQLMCAKLQGQELPLVKKARKLVDVLVSK